MRYSIEPKFRKYVQGYGFFYHLQEKLIDTANKTGLDAAKTASNISSKVRLIYLQDLKRRESYSWCFSKLNESVRTDNFSGRKTLSKLEPMYLEFKLKEAKFNWCVKT